MEGYRDNRGGKRWIKPEEFLGGNTSSPSKGGDTYYGMLP